MSERDCQPCRTACSVEQLLCIPQEPGSHVKYYMKQHLKREPVSEELVSMSE